MPSTLIRTPEFSIDLYHVYFLQFATTEIGAVQMQKMFNDVKVYQKNIIFFFAHNNFRSINADSDVAKLIKPQIEKNINDPKDKPLGTDGKPRHDYWVKGSELWINLEQVAGITVTKTDWPQRTEYKYHLRFNDGNLYTYSSISDRTISKQLQSFLETGRASGGTPVQV